MFARRTAISSQTWGAVKLVCSYFCDIRVFPFSTRGFEATWNTPRPCALGARCYLLCRFPLETACRPVRAFSASRPNPPPGKWKLFYGNFSLMQRGRQLRSGQQTAQRANVTATPRSSRGFHSFSLRGNGTIAANTKGRVCAVARFCAYERAMDQKEPCMNLCCAYIVCDGLDRQNNGSEGK